MSRLSAWRICKWYCKFTSLSWEERGGKRSADECVVGQRGGGGSGRNCNCRGLVTGIKIMGMNSVTFEVTENEFAVVLSGFSIFFSKFVVYVCASA
jgi:hypothetical protein